MNLYQFQKDEYAFFENILFAFSNGKRISLLEAKSIFDIYIYFCILQIGFDLLPKNNLYNQNIQD